MMLAGGRQIHLSKTRRTVHIVYAFVISSYMLFNVLDVDGSSSPRIFTEKPIMLTVVPSEIELPTSSELIPALDDGLVPINDKSRKFVSPQQASVLIFSSFHSARAHGYKRTLARNSLSDSSPYS